jgi:lipoprotein-anchoring transpeptidase ErfK/SrfK
MWILPPVHEAQSAIKRYGAADAPSWSFLSSALSSAAWRPARSALVVASFALTLHLVGAAGESDTGLAASALAAPSAHRTAAAELGAPAPTLLFGAADAACVTTHQAGQPMARAELTRPYTLGVRPGELGQSCALPGWYTPPPPGVPTQQGQVILVSLGQQWLWAFQDGRLVFATPVATGRERLRTPSGVYQVMSKSANVVFHSPWPLGSPYYYAPEHINYALLFRTGGFYIHDAPWREVFGPGSESLHFTPSGGVETGSHGCVNVPTLAADWLYHWAQVGTAIQITGAA